MSEQSRRCLCRSLHQSFRARDSPSHEFTQPALKLSWATLEEKQYRADGLQVLANQPNQDVGVQRTTSLRFDLSSEGQHWTKHASASRRRGHAIGAPFSGSFAACLASAGECLWPDIEDYLKKEPNQKLEHHSL